MAKSTKTRALEKLRSKVSPWAVAALVRENMSLRAALARSERLQEQRYGTSLGSITLELAGLIGRMLIAARAEGQTLYEGARVMEAVKAALYARRADALASAADRINSSVTGKQRGNVPKWEEDGPVAEQLREMFKVWTVRPLRADVGMMGTALDMSARMLTADRILPPVGTAEERGRLYAGVIEDVLATSADDTAEELAESIIVAAAKAAGVRRPSRLFDAARKREKAALSRAPEAPSGAPPGVFRTSPNVAEVPASSVPRLPDDPGIPAPSDTRPPPGRDSLRRDDDQQVVAGSRQRPRRD
jgi:hypothetical protein